MPAVNWTDNSVSYAGVQEVAVRQRWANWDGSNFVESAWTVIDDLHCESLQWSLLPSMPTARLVFYYGNVTPHGTFVPTSRTKLAIDGYYVRIRYTTSDGVLSWYGFIDEIGDEEQGEEAGVLTGKQTFQCYGLPQILAHRFITHSFHFAEYIDATPALESNLRVSGSGLTFNQAGKPNRTATLRNVYAPPPTDQITLPAHVFAPYTDELRVQRASRSNGKIWDDPKYWSSRDILEYLQAYMMPVDRNGRQVIPFEFTGLDVVPNWDQPTIESEGRTILSLVQQLVDPGRLMQISTSVDDSVVPNKVNLDISSTSDSLLNLPNGQTHPASTNTLTLTTRAAHDTSVAYQRSTTSIVNQVVVKGAKRQAVATVQISPQDQPPVSEITDFELTENWSEANENAYEAGFSGDATYDALSSQQQIAANSRVRGTAELENVFKSFVINPYSHKLFDPANATPLIPQDNVNFGLPAAYDFVEQVPYFNALQLMSVLPLRKGHNYGGATPVVDDRAAEFMRPIVCMKDPADTKYLRGSTMSNGVDPKFSVGSGVDDNGRALVLNVLGQPQHSIAASRFDALQADLSQGNVTWDYTEAQITIALQDDRYAESYLPETTAALADVDVIRQKLFYVGAAYQKIFMPDQTVVGIDDQGALVQSQDGLTDSEDYFRNNQDELDSLATIAAQWWLTPRQTLRLVSARPSAAVEVGQVLQTCDGNAVNTIVSQVSISSPLSVSEGGVGAPQPVSYQITTAAAERNPIAFAPKMTFVNARAQLLQNLLPSGGNANARSGPANPRFAGGGAGGGLNVASPAPGQPPRPRR